MREFIYMTVFSWILMMDPVNTGISEQISYSDVAFYVMVSVMAVLILLVLIFLSRTMNKLANRIARKQGLQHGK